MLPVKGCSPKENILVIGAYIIKILKEDEGERHSSEKIIKNISKDLAISEDHVILSLDWLYIINALSYDERGIYLYGID